MKWYTSTKPDDLQGLIYDEETGRNVAVTFDPKNARLIAAAPELLKALKALLDDVEYAQPLIKGGLIGNRQIRWARAAIAKAEEE